MVVSMSDVNYVVAESLRDNLYRGVDVLLLDCRPNDEYRLGNISGSFNIVLPQLMMRRLKANKLSLKSLVPPNFRQEKEAFLKKCLTYMVVLYEQFATDLNSNDPTLLSLLYNRMRDEGCSVFILKGGFSKFGESYPDLCAKKAESATSSDADDEECGCVSGPKCLRGGRCSPTSPLTQLGPTILGLGALTISCGNQEPDNAAFQFPSGNSTMTPRGTCDPRYNMNSEGESDYPNSATSESSSEMDRSHLKPSCIRIPPVTTNNATKSSPDNPPFQAGRTSHTGPVEILPGLFLGCAKDASSRETLTQFKITYILNVTPNLPNVFEGDKKFKYKQIAITDHWSQNLSQFFPDAISFIDEARSKKCGILVHCLAGISRSVTVTVAYLMQKYRWSLNDAYDFVKQRKNNVSPNFNFMGQLLDYEKTLGVGDSCGEACISSGASSLSSPPTLFFTSPPPPTPKLTLPVRKKSDVGLKQRSALIMTNTAS